mmetsp:Transcript_63764/g.146688  ORF Transcript_63764/g.146688 Transcript_63764/m.146688 type:complete len:236 (-) Transcript_63764:721-1428(-)
MAARSACCPDAAVFGGCCAVGDCLPAPVTTRPAGPASAGGATFRNWTGLPRIASNKAALLVGAAEGLAPATGFGGGVPCLGGTGGAAFPPAGALPGGGGADLAGGAAFPGGAVFPGDDNVGAVGGADFPVTTGGTGGADLPDAAPGEGEVGANSLRRCAAKSASGPTTTGNTEPRSRGSPGLCFASSSAMHCCTTLLTYRRDSWSRGRSLFLIPACFRMPFSTSLNFESSCWKAV